MHFVTSEQTKKLTKSFFSMICDILFKLTEFEIYQSFSYYKYVLYNVLTYTHIHTLLPTFMLRCRLLCGVVNFYVVLSTFK